MYAWFSVADYVALYQQQRAALVAKHNKRDQLLHALLIERKCLSVRALPIVYTRTDFHSVSETCNQM